MEVVLLYLSLGGKVALWLCTLLPVRLAFIYPKITFSIVSYSFEQIIKPHHYLGFLICNMEIIIRLEDCCKD